MATAKVTQYLVGASNKAKFPAMQGSQWSCNMFYSKNGNDEYMESVPGLKYLSHVTGNGRCRGAYVSTIGLTAQNSKENMFAVFGNSLYRFDSSGNRTYIGTVSPNGSRIAFAETGGPRALMLVADGANLYYYDLLEGGGLVQVQLPERITSRGGTVTPSHVAVVAGSIVVNDTDSGYCYYSIPYPLASDTRTMFKLNGNGKPEYESDGVTVKTEDVESRLHVFEDDYHVQQYFNTESSSDNINALYAVGPTVAAGSLKTGFAQATRRRIPSGLRLPTRWHLPARLFILLRRERSTESP